MTLYSHLINELKEFYVDKLGFRLVKNKPSGFEIEVGESRLEFKQAQSTTKPFYHFAFMIPANKFVEAKKWSQQRVSLMEEDEENEIFFPNSNAQSFYFIDPSGNIVEFICRKLISPSSERLGFSVEDVVKISEINLTTNEVISVGRKIREFGIPVRDNESLLEDSLNFLGEKEGGCFILLGPPKRRWIFSSQDSEIHPLIIEIDKLKRIKLDDKGTIRLSYE